MVAIIAAITTENRHSYKRFLVSGAAIDASDRRCACYLPRPAWPAEELEQTLGVRRHAGHRAPRTLFSQMTSPFDRALANIGVRKPPR
jgi:hypothetical protein